MGLTTSERRQEAFITDLDGRQVVVGTPGGAPFPQADPVTVSAQNTTVLPLTASATFTGTAENILPYVQINVALFGRPNTAVSGDGTDAKGSLFFEFSPDGTNWDISVPIVVRTLGVFIPYPLINVGKFFRVRYLNDGGAQAITILGTGETAGTPTNQTAFRLTSYLSIRASKELTRTLDQGVSGSDPTTLTRGLLMGKDPDGQFYVNEPASGNVTDNTTAVALAANATWTGAWHSRQGYVGIAVVVKTDQVSATNGLVIEHSDTMAGTVRSQSLFTLNSDSVSVGSMFITTVPQSQFFRVKYTNGASNQGSFYLETHLENTASELPRQAISGVLNESSTAVLSRGPVVAGNDSDVFANITRSPAGGFRVALKEHEVSTPILALTSWVTGQATIASTTVAVNVIPSPTSGRKTFAVKSLSSNTKTVFIGPTSAVTSGSGWELAAGEAAVVEVDQTTGVFVIGSTVTSQSLCFMEVI